MPVVGFVSSRSVDGSARPAAAFNKGLSETGYIEDQNVMVEYHWLSGQHDRLLSLMADLVRRRVAVIATAGDPPTLAAKAATATIPIVAQICAAILSPSTGKNCDGRHKMRFFLQSKFENRRSYEFAMK